MDFPTTHNDSAAKDQTTENKRTPRKSRAQNESARDQVRDFDISALEMEETGPLPNIPPRPGYVQRWVRVSIRNESDARNLSTRSRRGWLPRAADTVDRAYHHMMSQNETMGGIIGTHDLVLMERPIEIHRRAEQIELKKRRDLELAVKTNLFREHNSIGGSGSGFSAPKDESTAYVERGAPRIADDT